MADSEPDLYSFLRSKDLPNADAEEESPDADTSGSSETSEPDVEVVESFGTTGGDSAEPDRALSFEDDDLVDRLGTLSREALDEAPFGIVQVDDDGIVQFYNQYESNLADVDSEEAVGKNFFTQLAPCSGNRLFHGRFKKGVRKDNLDERFTYTFTYKMSPTLVDVRMHRDEANRNWVLIRKR